jgi:hypothetical protein
MEESKKAGGEAFGKALGATGVAAFYGFQMLDKVSPESMLLDPGYFSWETVGGNLYGSCGCAY